jgi:hypothetical protein
MVRFKTLFWLSGSLKMVYLNQVLLYVERLTPSFSFEESSVWNNGVF